MAFNSSRFRSMKRSIRRLQNAQQQPMSRPFAETDPLEQSSESEQIITVHLEQNSSEHMPSKTLASPSFNKADVTMQQLIKSGREGMLYKAKMTHGTIRGHTMFTCKIYKDAAKHEQVQTEVSIMRNLTTHLNLLQLVDWDITDVPYMLIMENAEYGSLRTFLRLNKERLCKDAELQHLFTIALYHIAQALDHLHSKMKPIPFRWYPPEYFKHDFYEFKGDVWAFGIVIWEMQTFGTVPYPDLKTSEEVVRYICAGHKIRDPEECRPEMLQMMRDCWQEPYIMRPSFLDIVKVLEKILENDRDYVNIESCPFIVAVESEDRD
ncbi:hypothetical protein QTP70_026970 [Hemibagrus guttatus]|uniref:Protein kinase domain-containing protein n=1 Tax=Hemibagrus guttatus TaxID=175788 RepID=A0AAE0UY39_9TELE|nr:hypothetical protein QTP70_026970 [Hemibagrus guttatus]